MNTKSSGVGPIAMRPISARTQLWAVAWLRWRMFVNSFRRGGSNGRRFGGLLLAILLRLILWPIFAVWVIGPVGAAGYLGWTAIHNRQPMWLLALLTGIAFLWQFIAVNGSNIAASVPTFDPSSLLRFPVPFGRYLLLRTLLGFLTPSTVIGCLALLAAAVGITVADVRLAPMAFLACGLYALMNIFFARMVGIWMERLLAVRHAREIFGGLMAILIVGFQFLRFGQPRHAGGGFRDSWIYNATMHSANVARWLPPGYAAGLVLSQGHPAVRTGELFLLSTWTALFLAGFAYRLHKQYLGEYLSDSPGGGSARASSGRASLASRPAAAFARPLQPDTHMASGPATRTSLLPALLRKEWLTIRSNTGQLLGMLTPLILVFLLSRGRFANNSSYLLPTAVGYAILGPLAAVYNIFGPEGPGVQMYLLAPVRMRDVVLAKNLASLAMLGAEAVLAWTIVVWTSPAHIPAVTQFDALLWVVFVLALNLAIGTLRSIQAPQKIMPGQARKMRSASASKTSTLLVLALVFASFLLEIPVTRLSRHYHAPWIAAVLFGALAAAALAGYAVLLRNVDALVLRNRDVLEQELCGV